MVRRIIVVLSLSVAAFAQAGPQAGSGPSTANLWVDTNGGTCTRQSSPGTWVDAQGCSSMQAAQTAASAGDTIVIKNGTYGAQTISSGGKASTVSFFAETYGSVLLSGDLTISINRIHVTGVTSTGGFGTRHSFDIEGTSSSVDILLSNGSWLTGFVTASNTTIDHNQIGDGNECTGPSEDALRLWGSGAISGVTVSHNKIFNYFKSPSNCDGNHADGIQIFTTAGGNSNMVFDGNVMYDNDTSNIETEAIAGSWIVQNNYLGPTKNGGNNLDIGRGTCTGVIIRNNTFDGSGTFNNGVTCNGGTSTTIRSNISVAVIGSCSLTPSNLDHNITPPGSASCGSSAKVCTPNWLNGVPSAANNYDIRLNSADTCAKDSGNTVNFPTTDFFGTTRPQGAAPDAGAFEIVAAGSPVVQLTPSPLNFPNTNVGSTSAITDATLTNNGPGILDLSCGGCGFGIAGSRFTFTGTTCGTNLGVSASCLIHLTFTPTTTGLVSGTLTVTSNASNSPTTITVNGTGTLGPQLKGNSIFAGQGVVK